MGFPQKTAVTGRLSLARSRKRGDNSDDNLIPMINIVFLLLIFFMVAGSVKPTEPLMIETPMSSQTGEVQSVHVLHIGLDGSFALGNNIILEEELGVAIKELMVETTVTTLSEDNRVKSDAKIQAPRLALRADAGTTFQRLREVAGILRVSGVDQIELLTTYSPADSESD